MLNFSFAYGDFSGYLQDVEKKHYLANFLLKNPSFHQNFCDVSNAQKMSLSRCLGDLSLENIKLLFVNYRRFEEILEAAAIDPQIKQDFEDWHIEKWGEFLRLLNHMMEVINQLQYLTGIDVGEYKNEISYLFFFLT